MGSEACRVACCDEGSMEVRSSHPKAHDGRTHFCVQGVGLPLPTGPKQFTRGCNGWSLFWMLMDFVGIAGRAGLDWTG